MQKFRTLPAMDYSKDFDNPSHAYDDSTGSGADSYYSDLGLDNARNCVIKFATRRYAATKAFSYSKGSWPGEEFFYSTERKRPRSNNCDHRRKRGICLPHLLLVPGSQAGTYTHKYFWRNQPYGTVVNVDTIDSHPSMDLTAASRSAWHTMQPRFEGDVSMFNFIVELKDVKKLGMTLINHPIRKLRNYFRRNTMRNGMVDVTKPLAECHLQAEFGLKPLISDIVTITCQLEEIVREAQEAFFEAGTERNVRHYTEYFVLSDEPSWHAYYQNKYPTRYEGTRCDLTFNANLDYAYAYSARSPIDAFMRYWGLMPTSQAIWDYLPFSFLLDYFFKIGDAIGRMEHDKNVELELYNYSESLLSREVSGGGYFPSLHRNGFIVVDGKAVYGEAPVITSGVESTLYTRKTVIPNTGTTLPIVRAPNTKQGANMAALMRAFF